MLPKPTFDKQCQIWIKYAARIVWCMMFSNMLDPAGQHCHIYELKKDKKFFCILSFQIK